MGLRALELILSSKATATVVAPIVFEKALQMRNALY